MKILSFSYLSFFLALSSCSQTPSTTVVSDGLPAVGSYNGYATVRARAVFDLTQGSGNQASIHLVSQAYAQGTLVDPVDISVTNAANVEFQISPDSPTGNLSIPTSPMNLLDFLSIHISKLQDNDLDVCGPSGHLRCNLARVQVYTVNPLTGISDFGSGPGLYSSANGTGAPLTLQVASNSGPEIVIGYGMTNNFVLSYSILASDEMITITPPFILDPSNPTYDYILNADFSGKPSGQYTTRIVFEYDLFAACIPFVTCPGQGLGV